MECSSPTTDAAEPRDPPSGVDTSARPQTPMSGRIASLDILRGVGVLGMLAVHMPLFAYVSLAPWNPTAYPEDLHGVNWWVWLGTYLLADGKFIAIFAMLFGAGIIIVAGPSTNAASMVARMHFRRMTALLVVGLLHAYLLWYDDMLVPLALCGVLVFRTRGLPARRLIVLGLLALAVAIAIPVFLTRSAMVHRPSDLAVWQLRWMPFPENIARETAQYRGSWRQQMAHRAPAAFQVETWEFVTRFGWQVGGLMLIGMGLFKLGVFTAARSAKFYARLAAIGFAGGLLLNAVALRHNLATEWDVVAFALVSQPLNSAGNFLVGLGWIGIVMLVCRRGFRSRALASVGRLALTNYLLQTVICTTIFYGHGFGAFGRIHRAGQLAIVMAIWIVQLVASTLWLRYFELGPVEWALRWSIFGHRPRLLRSLPATAAA